MLTAANTFPLQIFPDEQTRKSLPTLFQLLIQPFNQHLNKMTSIKANTAWHSLFLALKSLFCTFWYSQHLLQPLAPSLSLQQERTQGSPAPGEPQPSGLGARQAAKKPQFIWRSDRRGVEMSRVNGFYSWRVCGS